MSKFTFSVTLLATFTVEASTEVEAEYLVREAIDGNTANFGAWPDGSPVLADVSIEGELDRDEA
jgi:hypothetical protein